MRNIRPLLYLRGEYSRKHRISREIRNKYVTVVMYVTDRVKLKTTQRVNLIMREKRASQLHEFANSYTVPWATDTCQVRNVLHRCLARENPLDRLSCADPRVGYKQSSRKKNMGRKALAS